MFDFSKKLPAQLISGAVTGAYVARTGLSIASKLAVAVPTPQKAAVIGAAVAAGALLASTEKGKRLLNNKWVQGGLMIVGGASLAKASWGASPLKTTATEIMAGRSLRSLSIPKTILSATRFVATQALALDFIASGAKLAVQSSRPYTPLYTSKLLIQGINRFLQSSVVNNNITLNTLLGKPAELDLQSALPFIDLGIGALAGITYHGFNVQPFGALNSSLALTAAGTAKISDTYLQRYDYKDPDTLKNNPYLSALTRYGYFDVTSTPLDNTRPLRVTVLHADDSFRVRSRDIQKGDLANPSQDEIKTIQTTLQNYSQIADLEFDLNLHYKPQEADIVIAYVDDNNKQKFMENNEDGVMTHFGINQRLLILNKGKLTQNIHENYSQKHWEQELLTHEMGHALGLNHPHVVSEDIVNGQPVYPTFPGVVNDHHGGDFNQNSILNTVMSYRHPAYEDQHIGVSTPMSFDVAALQAIYGRPKSIPHSGDDTYFIDTAVDDGYRNIWDIGGVNTLSLKNKENRGAILDLRDAPLVPGDNAGGYRSRIIGTKAGVTLAHETIMHNAVGGQGADTFIGNDLDNIFYSGGGSEDSSNEFDSKDLISTGHGNDRVIVSPSTTGDPVVTISITDFEKGKDKIDLRELKSQVLTLDKQPIPWDVSRSQKYGRRSSFDLYMQAADMKQGQISLVGDAAIMSAGRDMRLNDLTYIVRIANGKKFLQLDENDLILE